MNTEPRHPIRLMEHDTRWRQEFEQSRSSILQATEGWVVDVQHVGGTALTDAITQPIVDLMAGMSDLRGLNEAAMLIEGLNYRRMETPDWCSNELCAWLCKPRSGETTHSVLLLRHEGTCWHRTIRIRNWLETHLVDKEALQTAKRDSRVLACDAQQRYDAGKNAFFEELELRMADGH